MPSPQGGRRLTIEQKGRWGALAPDHTDPGAAQHDNAYA